MSRVKNSDSSTIKTIAELRGLSRGELRGELIAIQKEYYILQMKHMTRELKQPHLLTQKRRYIAQISTFLTTAL